MKFFSDRTFVPLGFALFTIGGGAAWLTTLHLTTQANAASLREVSERQLQYNQSIVRIEKDLAEIKGELKRIKK